MATTGQTATAGQTPGQAESGGAVEQAKARVGQLADQVQQQASEKAKSGLAKGKTRAAETLHDVAQSLLISSPQLSDQNQAGVSSYVERAAGQLDRVAQYLQTAEPDELVDRVEDFARRQPALFIGGAFALGLLGARFLKSSRRDRAAGEWRQGVGRLPTRISYPADREIAEAPVGGAATVAATAPYAPGYGAPGV
jgi:ElaB/YqjD/DUF883 family membrane-anchored ribosome-binding protein